MVSVKLMSSDNASFSVDEDVANESQTIKNLIEDASTDDAIPLPNVSGKILAKVIEFSKFHVEANKKGDNDKPSKSDDEIKVEKGWGDALKDALDRTCEQRPALFYG